MTTDCGESVEPATATLVSQHSPRSLLQGLVRMYYIFRDSPTL
jgi:hypothetical protein